jgi:hypothetical protein
MFVSKTGAYPSEAPFMCFWLLALSANIRIGWKGLRGTNTLAYYEKSKIAAVKSFIGFSPAVSCLLDLCLISWQI